MDNYQHLDGESPRFVLWMTAAVENREHCVTFAQVAARVRYSEGVYKSICGACIAPLSMTAPPGPRCQRCKELHREWVATSRPAPGKHGVLRRIARLYRRRRPTT
jgi:hypothetical protein